MKRTNLKNITVADNHFEQLIIFLDDGGSLVLLPLLYSIYLETAGEVIKVKEYIKQNEIISEFYSDPVADTSISTYIGHVFAFFQYIEQKSGEGLAPSVHQSYLLQTQFINEYLNVYLPSKLTSSSLGTHQASIKSYFNFIAKLGLNKPPQLKVSRKARKIAFDNNKSQDKINYISTEERFALLKICTNKRDRLIIRLGAEVGLRTSENQGLILKHKNQKKGYLLELFEQLHDPSKKHIDVFRFWLRGQFTKGGKSRMIFFSRDILIGIEDYWLTERAQILSKTNDNYEPDTLFVNNDQRFFGKPVSIYIGTKVFKQYLRQVEWMDQSLSYHDLRHTFATELYHSELIDNRGQETRSESAALIKVAQRLGHALGKDGRPTEVTSRYIRLRESMISIEEGQEICI